MAFFYQKSQFQVSYYYNWTKKYDHALCKTFIYELNERSFQIYRAFDFQVNNKYILSRVVEESQKMAKGFKNATWPWGVQPGWPWLP